MPTAEVEVLDIRQGYILTEFTALHLRAVRDFTDVYSKKRKAGEEWIVTQENMKVGGKSVDSHIIEAEEELIQEKRIIVLDKK